MTTQNVGYFLILSCYAGANDNDTGDTFQAFGSARVEGNLTWHNVKMTSGVLKGTTGWLGDDGSYLSFDQKK